MQWGQNRSQRTGQVKTSPENGVFPGNHQTGQVVAMLWAAAFGGATNPFAPFIGL